MAYEIRSPIAADADRLGEIHVRAWQEGYRDGLMPDEYLGRLDVGDRADMWRQALAAPPREGHVRLVADDGDGPVGFIVVGPADGRPEATQGEVFSLNVHPDHWGRGAGGDLLAAGVVALAQSGFDQAVLWVHRDNARARRFYEARGWVVGEQERTVEIFDVEVPEALYTRALP